MYDADGTLEFHKKIDFFSLKNDDTRKLREGSNEKERTNESFVDRFLRKKAIIIFRVVCLFVRNGMKRSV